MADICAVLTVFKRPEMLKLQLSSLLQQSIRPKRILIWVNGGNPFTIGQIGIPIHIHHSSENIGVWGRFTLPLIYQHQFYCVFDDDTLPGSEWFRNCLASYESEAALLGTIGLRFLSNDYVDNYRVGWDQPNEISVPVDIVGHSWFFDRKMIEAFWSEPQYLDSPLAGEDIHFSFAIQRRLGVRTIVPPHPANNRAMWGADPSTSKKVGTDENAISMTHEASTRFRRAFLHYRHAGFRTIRDIIGL